MSQQIDRSEAMEFFNALQRAWSNVAFWSYDRTNGEQRFLEGRLTWVVNGAALGIEDAQGDETFIEIVGVDFVRLERDEVPDVVMPLMKDSFDYILGFPAGKYGCCLMAKDARGANLDSGVKP